MGDIGEIKQVKYRYLRALDTKHWDEFADTLTEDVVGDYDGSIGESHHFTDRGSLVEFMRSAMPANIITEHRVTHPEIAVNGTEQRHLVSAGPRDCTDSNLILIGAAFYHDQYRKTGDGWRISRTGYDRTYDATVPRTKGLNFKLKTSQALNI